MDVIEFLEIVKALEADPHEIINNEGYEASLELGKLYRVIPDEKAAQHGYILIVDESGEDYGYSLKRFFPIEIPMALEKALVAANAV